MAVGAAHAFGSLSIEGAEELRVKESDRLQGTIDLIRAFGGQAENDQDTLFVHGPTNWRAATIDSRGDHRIAMAGAIAGCLAHGETKVLGTKCVETSYPGFFRDLDQITEPY